MTDIIYVILTTFLLTTWLFRGSCKYFRVSFSWLIFTLFFLFVRLIARSSYYMFLRHLAWCVDRILLYSVHLFFVRLFARSSYYIFLRHLAWCVDRILLYSVHLFLYPRINSIHNWHIQTWNAAYDREIDSRVTKTLKPLFVILSLIM